MTQDAQLIEPLVQETWVMDGNALDARPQDANALYIAPLVHQLAAPQDLRIIHSVLRQQCPDRHVGESTSVRSPVLSNLFRSTPLELNPVMALIEKHQNFAGASQSVYDLAELLGRTFGSWTSKANAADFERILPQGKPEMARNIDLLRLHPCDNPSLPSRRKQNSSCNNWQVSFKPMTFLIFRSLSILPHYFFWSKSSHSSFLRRSSAKSPRTPNCGPVWICRRRPH